MLNTFDQSFSCFVLSTGYLAMEALDEDCQLSQICLYCGIIPDASLGKNYSLIINLQIMSPPGDGGEDVSCTLEACHLEISNTEAEGKFPAEYVTDFLDQLKTFFIGGLVYPRLQMGMR